MFWVFFFIKAATFQNTIEHYFKRCIFDFSDPYNTTEINTIGDLTLSDIKLELFRELRFYEDITHLKYLCDVNWPYKWVPFAVFGFVLSFALSCVGVFGYR